MLVVVVKDLLFTCSHTCVVKKACWLNDYVSLQKVKEGVLVL